MLVARKLVNSNIVRDAQIACTKRIGRVPSSRGFPILDVAHRVNDLGARVGLCAAIDDTAGLTCKRIVNGLISQRRIRTGILLFRVLSAGQPAWLRKAHIDVVSYRADMGMHPLEDLLAALVLVEAEGQKGT